MHEFLENAAVALGLLQSAPEEADPKADYYRQVGDELHRARLEMCPEDYSEYAGEIIRESIIIARQTAVLELREEIKQILDDRQKRGLDQPVQSFGTIYTASSED